MSPTDTSTSARSCPLSPYGRASQRPSPVARMMAQFAADFRDDIDINLGVGYVSADTIPDELIQRAVRHVLDHPQNYRQPLNYGGPAGSANLIESIRRYLVQTGIGQLTGEVLKHRRVVIGPSGATSLLDAFADLLEPGIVITADPMYYIFTDVLARRGHRIVTVPEDDNGLDPDRLEATLQRLGRARENVRFVYLCTVSNPTGAILANDRRAQIVQLITRYSHEIGRTVPIIADTAYEPLIHDPQVEPPQSMMLHDDEGLVHEIGTFSKVLAPALRIGYVIAPDSPLLQAMVQKTSDIGFSAPVLNQEVASYLIDHHVDRQIRRVRQIYREKGLSVGTSIRRHLGDAVKHCIGGRAGFYYYLTLDDVRTDEASRFFRFLSRTTGEPAVDGPHGQPHPRVVYLPGAFCAHPEGDLVERAGRQMRISYGYESTERIDQALQTMAEGLRYAAEG